MRVLSKNNIDRSGYEFALSDDVLSDPKQSLTKSYDIVSARDASFIYDFVINNRNTTQFGKLKLFGVKS